MANFCAPIDRLPRVLGQKHGLWHSAYHLIHPDCPFGSDYQSQFGDITQTGQGMRIWGENASQEWPHGAHAGLGFSFESDCVGDLGCWAICDDDYTCQDPDDPTHTKGCGDGADTVSEYYPSVITAKRDCSTFGQEHYGDDAWYRTGRKLIRGRERELECRLASGDCVMSGEGDDATPVNPFFSQPIEMVENPDDPDGDPVPAPGSFQILNGGDPAAPTPMPLEAALAAIDNSLGFCDSEEAGMIHMPAAASTKLTCGRCIREEIVDYGDGMGERSILRTATRGNIVVAGVGYDGTGPNGEEAPDGTAWIYGTSMVYLVWDKVVFTPSVGEHTSHFKDNRVEVVAEQIVGAFYGPCCNYAVLADLCSCSCS